METNGKKFYLPCKPVLNQSAETTELWIVYDGSARNDNKAPSMNECLRAGPPLQNQRFHLVELKEDLKQAFLEVRIREEDRNVMRFH